MKTQKFGAWEIDRVEENGRFVFPARGLFDNVEPELMGRYREILGEGLIDGATDGFVISFHSFIVRSRGKTILVDTCNGNHKERYGLAWQHQLASNHYIESLAGVGLRPEDIDIVMCTHLHGDHVGWNTCLVDGRWQPTFPNARYIMSKQDFEFFERQSQEIVNGRSKHLAFADSILPVAEAGLVDQVDVHASPITEIAEGVTIEAAPGHTMGNVLMRVEGGGDAGYLTGDIIHHPIQFLVPELYNGGDQEHEIARKTREALIERIADEGAMLLPGHFPDPSAGRISRKDDGGYRFDFVED